MNCSFINTVFLNGDFTKTRNYFDLYEKYIIFFTAAREESSSEIHECLIMKL